MGGVLRSASAIGKSGALPRSENRGVQSRHRQGTTPSLIRPRHLALHPTPLCAHVCSVQVQQQIFFSFPFFCDGYSKSTASDPEPDRVLAPGCVPRRPPARQAIHTKPTVQSTVTPTNRTDSSNYAHWRMHLCMQTTISTLASDLLGPTHPSIVFSVSLSNRGLRSRCSPRQMPRRNPSILEALS